MRRARAWLLLVPTAAALFVGMAGVGMFRGAPDLKNRVPVSRAPGIKPDYTGLVIPPNIAPLNFCITEPGLRFHVKVSSARGDAIEVGTRKPSVVIPPAQWKRLLNENRGEDVRFDVCVESKEGTWQQFDSITNTVARDDADRYVVYRVINVLYNYYLRMKMYQYDLETSSESLVLDNRSFGNGCMNCHTFLNNRADAMLIQMRSSNIDYGAGMLIIRNGVLTKVNTRTKLNPDLAAFAAWHPSGRALAFSTNKVRQFFHSARTEVREGIDMNSGLAIYVVDTNKVLTNSKLSKPDELETWPAWSPDGRYLYFCSAPSPWDPNADIPPPHYDELKYDLVRIGFDVKTGTWGELETVLSARETGKSITLPRISPDGRFLIFCMSDYSGFPALQPDADLYLMDLNSRKYSRLDCNSDESESWHSWSSNGRWIVFSSKRGDKLFMKAYLSYIDENGKAHKPFVMPQKDPEFYDSFARVYHLPEFVRDPVPLKGEAIASAIRSAPWVDVEVPVTSPSPGAGSQGKQPAQAPPSGAEPWTPAMQ